MLKSNTDTGTIDFWRERIYSDTGTTFSLLVKDLTVGLSSNQFLPIEKIIAELAMTTRMPRKFVIKLFIPT